MTCYVSINSLDTRIGRDLLSSVRLPTGVFWVDWQNKAEKVNFWHENVHTTLFGYTVMRLNPIYRRALFHLDTYEARVFKFVWNINCRVDYLIPVTKICLPKWWFSHLCQRVPLCSPKMQAVIKLAPNTIQFSNYNLKCCSSWIKVFIYVANLPQTNQHAFSGPP